MFLHFFFFLFKINFVYFTVFKSLVYLHKFLVCFAYFSLWKASEIGGRLVLWLLAGPDKVQPLKSIPLFRVSFFNFTSNHKTDCICLLQFLSPPLLPSLNKFPFFFHSFLKSDSQTRSIFSAVCLVDRSVSDTGH